MSLKIIALITSLFFYYYNIFAEDVDQKYDRKTLFTGPSAWLDIDRDCQDTRAEVLIKESINDSVTFRSDKRCVVDSGVWYDSYSGKIFYAAGDMDIEHVVALKDAWVSGAMHWSFEKRNSFTNYMNDRYHLMAVDRGENRSKGARGPDKYLPPNDKFVKEYFRRYIRVKVTWNLTVTRDQLYALQQILGDEKIIYPKVR